MVFKKMLAHLQQANGLHLPSLLPHRQEGKRRFVNDDVRALVKIIAAPTSLLRLL